MKKKKNNSLIDIKNRVNSFLKKEESNEAKIIAGIVILVIMLTGFFMIAKNLYEREIYKNSRPIVEIIGDKHISINVGELFKDPGAEAHDYLDNNITNKIVVQGKVDTSKEGVYYLYYSVTNSRGLKSEEALRVVKVEKKTDDNVTNEGKGISSKDTKQLRKIIEEVVSDHRSELVQFGDDSCKMVDYLTPFINNYYYDDDYPDREVLRPMVKEVLGVE